ncbi:MAG: hypothetical protein JSU70_22425 [Phycisphaerales bacterium]|nr:MAG: hypothetical protein JSU70_22425 [Phycisphaerales bacterium]
MNANRYLRPAGAFNGSVRTDLPLTVFSRARKKKLATAVATGQLCCVGKVYLKTSAGLVRIR